MRKVLTVLSKTIATLFAILFVITAVLVILLFNIERQMFSANLYKSALTEEQVYERLPGILGELLTTSISYNPCTQNPLVCEDISPELQACFKQALGEEQYMAFARGRNQPTETDIQKIQPCLDEYGTPTEGENTQPGESGMGAQGGMPPFMKNLKAADWETIIRIIIPPKELQPMTESVLDQMFAYLNGEVDTVMVSLVKLKERLAGQAGADAIKQLIRAQPPCTLERLTQMAVSAITGGGGMVLCNPPADILNVMLPQLQEQLNAIIPQIPDEAIIIKPPASGSTPAGSGPFGADPITTIRMARLILRFSFLLPLALLLLITLFGVRSLKGWLRWWGIPIFFAGAIALGPAIAALPALNLAWKNFVAPHIPPYISADIAGIGHDLARFILHGLSEQIILQAVILVVLGLAAWVGSYFIKVRREESIPATPTT
jgi:hypothetical protein